MTAPVAGGGPVAGDRPAQNREDLSWLTQL